MSHLRGLLVDFGGVLTSDLWESIRGATRRMGLPEDTILDLMGQDPEGHARFTALERGDIVQHEYEAFVGERLAIPADGLLASLCVDLQPVPEMADGIAVLRAMGIRVAVVSNSWGSGRFNPYLGYGLEELVDLVVISHEVRLRKPEPAIFSLALEGIGVTEDQTVFVDDVAANLVPARHMGMQVVHHRNSAQTLKRLGELFAVPLAI